MLFCLTHNTNNKSAEHTIGLYKVYTKMAFGTNTLIYFKSECTINYTSVSQSQTKMMDYILHVQSDHDRP